MDGSMDDEERVPGYSVEIVHEGEEKTIYTQDRNKIIKLLDDMDEGDALVINRTE